jgi:sulfur carrier protein
MITIQLDGRPHELPDACTLAALVEALGHAPHGIATAVDGLFVPRVQRAEITLHEGAAVLLFQPIVGG